MGRNAQFLAVVATVHHHRVRETLDDRASGLAESLALESAGGVRQVGTSILADGDVVAERDILDIQLVIRPKHMNSDNDIVSK